MARVAVLTFTRSAYDVRVQRHIHALRGQHEIVSCGRGEAPDGVAEHLRIPDAAAQLPKKPSVIANLAARRFVAAYGGSDAANEARRLLAGADFDMVLSNDVLALPCAIDAAGSRPVVADLHEFAPGQVGGLRFSLMVGPLMDALCREYLPRAAAVTTVCDGIAGQYQSTYGVEVATITNAAAFRAPVPRAANSPVRLVHSGRAMPNRHLEVMMRAAADVPGVVLDLYLLPSDWTEDYLQSLRALAARTANVSIKDALPRQQLWTAMDSYDVGVFVLPPTSVNALHTLPNKFFDYVQSGLGILIGPSPEMASLTRSHGMGQVLADFSEESLRAALLTMEPAEVARWKAASCGAARELSGEHEAAKLRGLVDRVLAAA